MSSFNTKNTFKFLVILKISLIKMIGLKCVEKKNLKKIIFFNLGSQAKGPGPNR